MPQCLPPKEPPRLFELCVDYATTNIDKILKYEEQCELDGTKARISFQELPSSLFHLISDMVLSNGSFHDNNYRKILSLRTNNIIGWESKGVKKITELMSYMLEHCKKVVKMDLSPIFPSGRRDVDRPLKMVLVGQTLASMNHLEWVNLKDCGIGDEFLKCIGSKCSKLKYLNIEGCTDVTDVGIRALCDRTLAPKYGNCTQLTHLHLKRIKQLSPEIVSLFLLNCPNLRYLDSELNGQAVAEAIGELDSSYALKSYKSVAKKFATLRASGSTLLNTNRSRSPIFNLRNLEYNCESAWNEAYNEKLFRAVGKYCPLLEHLTMGYHTVSADDLKGLFMLQLQSISLEGGRLPTRFKTSAVLLKVGEGVLALLHSVSNSLTTLKFKCATRFDLRVIKIMCPNLTTLHLESCNTTREISLPSKNYSVDVMSDATFVSLTHLTISSTRISQKNVVDLLSSPSLKTLELSRDSNVNTWIHGIQEVLITKPAAFCKLQEARFSNIKMDKSTIVAILERAEDLNYLKLRCECVPDNGPVIRRYFNEKPYFDQLIMENNWDLKMDWGQRTGVIF